MRFITFALSVLLAAMPFGLNAQDAPDGSQSADQDFIPGLLQKNPNASIFYSALVATHLSDTLEQYLDPNYPPIDYEWTMQAIYDGSPSLHYHQTSFEKDYICYPEKREFKYTLFVMPDNELAAYNDKYWTGGIHSLDELRQYAEKVYPEGKGLPDDSRSSSLNKLISYHILPCWLSYDKFNVSEPDLIRNRRYLDEFDVEDFFETLLPHSVMRISTPYDNNSQSQGIYINRKGTEKTGLVAEGIKIANGEEYLSDNLTNICVNGGYHYINKMLVYDDDTRTTALQTRMRIMASTLSPDFINSGARGRLRKGYSGVDYATYTYKPGFCKNVKWTEGSSFYVRYQDKSFGTYYGDELSIAGAFDITFRLPPVSKDGLYEIRIWNNAISGLGSNYRGTVLFHMGNDENNLIPCSAPVDMNINLNDPSIGTVQDNDSKYDGMNDEQRAKAIDENDKLIHQRGYMKAPDSYGTSSSPLRDDVCCYRKVVCEMYMEADKDYYIRLRQMGDNLPTFAFNFIEIVPYSVYSGENGPEDKH